MDPVVINKELCVTGCGACISECAENVFILGGDDKAQVEDGDACVGESTCGDCLAVCQQSAITINATK